MDFIRPASTETTHALEAFDEVDGFQFTEKGRRAVTWCGRKVVGRTGSTIASGIDCRSCQRSMRKEGWQV